MKTGEKAFFSSARQDILPDHTGEDSCYVYARIVRAGGGILKKNRIRKRRIKRNCRFRTLFVTVLMAISFAVQAAGNGTFLSAEAVYAAEQTDAGGDRAGSPVDDSGTGAGEEAKESVPAEDAGRGGTRMTGGAAGIPGEGSGGQSPGKTGETDADTVKTDTTAAGQTKEAETGQTAEVENSDNTGNKAESGQEGNQGKTPETLPDQGTGSGNHQDRDAENGDPAAGQRRCRARRR